MKDPLTSGERMARTNPTDGDARHLKWSYEQFLESSYAYEMRRRYDYYNAQQFMFDPTVQAVEAFGQNVTPSEWNAAMGGFGWADIRSMLPQVTNEQCIHPVGIPFVPTIVDNKQVVYTVPPESRTVFFGKDPDEAATKLLSEINDAAGHDDAADQLCKWTGLFDTAFQFIGWDARYRRVVKRNLLPHQVYVVPAEEAPGDLQHPECLVAILQQGQGMTDTSSLSSRPVFQVWWRDRFWYEEAPGFEFTDPDLTIRGTNANPYRDKYGYPIKPIIVTHSTETDEVYYKGSDNLVLLNQRIDRDFTALSYAAEYQGFAIFAVEGMEPHEIAAQPWAAGAAFGMPPGVKAQFLHPLTPTGELLNAAIKKVRTFARMLGIDPEIVDPEVKATSGVSKSHGRRVLAERREEQFPKWLPYERESYWITSHVWNYHQRVGKTLPVVPRFKEIGDDAPFYIEVIFGELEPTVDPLAEIYTSIAKMKANLLTRVEWLMADRRISREAAEELAKSIKEDNEADGIIADFSETSGRIGQPGNRPQNMDRPKDKTGGNVTAFSGNQTIDPGASSGGQT